MYFIANPNELIGKEIEFVHFAQFAEAMVIVTKDKGIFVFDKDEDGEIEVFNQFRAREHILESKYIRGELNKTGIITTEEIDKYQDELQARWKKEAEERKKVQEEQDYKRYLELKEKFKERDSIEDSIEMKKFRKTALGITREEFMERNSNMCLYSVYGIGHKRSLDYCNSTTCAVCQDKAIENVKFKGE